MLPWGTWPWQCPSPEDWGAWNTGLGARKGSSTAAFPTESDHLLWESWEKTPKPVLVLQGAGGGVQGPQWHPGQHNLSSRSISRYLIMDETHEHSAALCCPSTVVQLLLWCIQLASTSGFVLHLSICDSASKS